MAPGRRSDVGQLHGPASGDPGLRHAPAPPDAPHDDGWRRPRVANPPGGGSERTMARVLVIHGAGMNMRGKVQVDIFGPMTLPEYDERIRGYAKELGVEVEIFHSNIEGEIVKRLYAANARGVDAAIF